MNKELQQTPTPIPEEFTKAMHARAVQYGGGRSGYESFTDGAEWAYRLLSSQGLRWVKVKDATPPMIEGKDYSENVLVICDGKLGVMAYCWFDCDDHSGTAWCNCYGDINGDPEFDDGYFPTYWTPLPTAPIQ